MDVTTVAILADPPLEEVVLSGFSPSPLSAEEAAELYRAMLADVTAAVDASGGETLLNYRDADGLTDEVADGRSEGTIGDDEVSIDDAEASIRAVVSEALDSLEDVRFEVQVGSQYYARVGNTITHLLEREGTNTAAVVAPTAPFLTRSVIDSAAMKLRSSDVILGPTTDGRLYYAGFGEPMDFTDAFEPPAVETVTRRAREEELSVDFLPMLPVIERPDDLTTAVPMLHARTDAGRMVPDRTAAAIEALGLSVVDGDDGLEITRA